MLTMLKMDDFEISCICIGEYLPSFSYAFLTFCVIDFLLRARNLSGGVGGGLLQLLDQTNVDQISCVR